MSADVKSAVSIRRATEADVDALSDVKARAWGGAAGTAWRRRWRWQFMEHPHRIDADPTFVVAESLGRVIGGIGWLPLRLDMGRDVRKAAFGCDLFVDPLVQRSGAGRALIAEVGRYNPMTVWMGASRETIGLFSRIGFPRLEPVRFMALAVDPSALLRASFPGNTVRLLAPLAAPAGWVVRGLCRPRTIPRGADWDDDIAFDAAWERFVAKRGRSAIATPVRDGAYMRWRYRDNPLGSYGLVAARQGQEIVGLVAYRVRNAAPRLGVVSEVMIDPSLSGLAEALVTEAVRRMCDSGAAAIKALATDPMLRGALWRVGFLPTPLTPHAFLTPDPAGEAGLSLDGRRWDLSLGDSDLDFS